MAASLLALLLFVSPRPAAAAVARVEISPISAYVPAAPSPFALSMPAPALAIAPSLSAAPLVSAPLSAPPAAQEAAAVPAALPAAQAAIVPGLPAAPASPVASAQAHASAAAGKIEETARSLDDRNGASGRDLLARDYSVFQREDIRRAGEAMMAASASPYQREVVHAVFSRNPEAQEKLIKRLVDSGNPQAWPAMLAIVYRSLRAAYFDDRSPESRAAVSVRLQDSAARFFERIAADPALPDEARGLARGVSTRYLTEDRLLTALAWGRQEKERIAEGRRELAAEIEASPDLAEKLETPNVGKRSEDREWLPPGVDAAPPAKAGTGVWRRTTDLIRQSRVFKNQFARFQLARGRWYASKRIALSAPAAAREKARWGRAVSSFVKALHAHEHVADYTLDGTLRLNFAYLKDGGIRGRMLHPPHPSVVLYETPEGYVLQAAFETKIQDPAVVAAFQRSIERYWTRAFMENGRRRRFTTHVAVRVLAPGEDFTAGSLRLADGKTQSSAGSQSIDLSREFSFFVPAHEFGHIMGLPDEYIDEFIPERMVVVDEQDRSSLMANQEGLLQSRHLLQIIAAMREAGRLRK